MGSNLSSGLKEFAVLRGRQRHKQRPTVCYGVTLPSLGWGRGGRSVEGFLQEWDSEQNLKGHTGVRSGNGWQGCYGQMAASWVNRQLSSERSACCKVGAVLSEALTHILQFFTL